MMSFVKLRLIFTVCFFVLWFPAYSLALDGRVVKVTDGDTLHVLTSGHQLVRVRLRDIDAPERGQPYGKKAQYVLADLVFGKWVHSDGPVTLDRYKRALATLWVDHLNVNQTMVAMGYAWVYTRYNTDQALPGIQLKAQQAKIGLWQLQSDQRVPPWLWRRNVRQTQP